MSDTPSSPRCTATVVGPSACGQPIGYSEQGRGWYHLDQRGPLWSHVAEYDPQPRTVTYQVPVTLTFDQAGYVTRTEVADVIDPDFLLGASTFDGFDFATSGDTDLVIPVHDIDEPVTREMLERDLLLGAVVDALTPNLPTDPSALARTVPVVRGADPSSIVLTLVDGASWDESPLWWLCDRNAVVTVDAVGWDEPRLVQIQGIDSDSRDGFERLCLRAYDGDVGKAVGLVHKVRIENVLTITY